MPIILRERERERERSKVLANKPFSSIEQLDVLFNIKSDSIVRNVLGWLQPMHNPTAVEIIKAI